MITRQLNPYVLSFGILCGSSLPQPAFELQYEYQIRVGAHLVLPAHVIVPVFLGFLSLVTRTTYALSPDIPGPRLWCLRSERWQSRLAQSTNRPSGRLTCIWHVHGSDSWPTTESESYSGHNPHQCAALTSGNPSKCLSRTGTVGMPTINPPDGSSTQLEPRPAHQYHLRSYAVHAYLGLAVTLVIVTIWCFRPRRRLSTPSSASYGSQPNVKEIKASLGCAKLAWPELTEGSYPNEFSQDLVLATPFSVNELSHPLSSAYTKVPLTPGHLQAMDSDYKSQLSDRSDPEATASRGVSKKPKSTPSSEYEAYLWPQPPSSVSMTGSSTPDQLRKNMPPPKTSTGTERTISSGSTSREEGRGKEPLQTQHRQIDGFGTSTTESLGYDGVQRQDGGLHGVSVGEPRLHFTRPPPPPPLTPPTLDKTAFAFQGRRPTYAASIPPGLDVSLIHQPHPDYIGHTSSVDILRSSPAEATAIPRRRSYTKSVPVGIPIPSSSSSSSSSTTVTSSSAFSPSRYPPSSPLFPPPPPVPQDYQFVGGHMGHRASVGNQHQEETEVHGEIISVTDDDGHGWQRHTQVYGGGVCLVCLANGGGSYGPNVPLEDRRY